MAIAFRSKSMTIDTSTGTDIVATEPSGAAADDILLYAMAIFVGAGTITAPTGGWSVAYSHDGSNLSTRVWWIRRGASPPGFTASWTSSQGYAEALVLAYSGCITTGTPYDDAQGNYAAAANPCNPDPPSATSSGASRLAVAIGSGWAGESGSGWSLTGYTTRESGAGAGQALSAHDKSVGSGAENPAAISGGAASADNADGITIILTPPAAASTELPDLTMAPLQPPRRWR